MFCFLYTKENLALFKPAYQDYPYKGSHIEKVNASDAVDGIKLNQSDYEDHCVLSDERKQTATWWVNLTSISSIHHIRAYYMTGKQKWGMQCSQFNRLDKNTPDFIN